VSPHSVSAPGVLDAASSTSRSARPRLLGTRSAIPCSRRFPRSRSIALAPRHERCPQFDRGGALVGVLSTGLNHPDYHGPSNAAWLIDAPKFSLNLVWPPGLYQPETRIIEHPDRLIEIIGRDKVPPDEIDYKLWQ
jgi:hypothetical protein